MTDSADAGNGERSNRAFAHMFAEALNATYPGLLHKVTTVAGNRYNQDLFPNMLLLEVGNHLDMEADAITTGTLLADVIAQLLLELDD